MSDGGAEGMGGSRAAVGWGALGIWIRTEFSPSFLLQQLSLRRMRHHATMITMMAITAPLDRTKDISWTPSKWRPPFSSVVSTMRGLGGGVGLELHMLSGVVVLWQLGDKTVGKPKLFCQQEGSRSSFDFCLHFFHLDWMVVVPA